MKTILLSVIASLNLYCSEILDAQTGQPHPDSITEARGAFNVNPSTIGGEKIAVYVEPPGNTPTSTTYIWNTNLQVIVIGTTKIRPDYPQDYTLIQAKVTPSHEGYKVLGGMNYNSSLLGSDHSLVFQETNLACSFRGPDDLQFIIHSNGFSNESKYCRTDMHFVKNGFYIQVVAISPKKDSDTHASNDSLSLCQVIQTKVAGN